MVEAKIGKQCNKCTVQDLDETSATVYWTDGPQRVLYKGTDTIVDGRTCRLQREALRRLI